MAHYESVRSGTTTREQIASFKRSLDFALATGHNFNRQVLPFLRLIWTNLREPEPEGPESKLGIDFLTPSAGRRFECAICCRGFKAGKPDAADLSAILRTIAAWRESDFYCERFTLLHNADPANTDFRDAIRAALKQLGKSTNTRTVEALSRLDLVDQARRKVLEILEGAFRRNATELLNRQQALFRFGRVYLPLVPLSDPRVSAKRSASQELKDDQENQDISGALRPTHHAGWTILTGVEGSGKTAAVLHAVRSQDKAVMIVPTAALSLFNARRNVTRICEDLARYVEAFSGIKAVYDQETLYRFAGQVLAESLQDEKCPYLLVVDGLDETRPADERETLECLLRHLGGLRCQVVLTTADAAPARFAPALESCAQTRRRPRRLTLEPWTKQHMVDFTSQALRRATDEERQRLVEFVVLLQKDQFLSVYGNLPAYPLFLHMILEQVAETGVQCCNKSDLFRSWIDRRIRRAFPSSEDREAALDLVEDIAGRLISEQAGNFELAEMLDLKSAQKLAMRRSRKGGNLIDPLLAESLLVAQPPQRSVNVGFSFEMLQAYCTACYLLRENLPPAGYPICVQSLYQELLGGA